jgi:HEAT repeat protein
MPKKSSGEFPGFDQCMAMMRKRKIQEEAYFWLLPRISEFIEPLLAELENERDIGVQAQIVELLAAARSVRALSVFLQHLSSPNQWLRMWAEQGLRELKQTSEGRKALWELYWRRTSPPISLSTDDERLLHETLERILH